MKSKDHDVITCHRASQIPTFPRYKDWSTDEFGEAGDIDMLAANRRRTERRLCKRVAKIHWGTGSLPRDCTVTDISAGGVKVIAELLELPPQFTITFSPDHSRKCRLAWRIGCEFGAEFID